MRLMPYLRPLFLHNGWRRNCAKFDWKNLVLLRSVFGDVSCRGYRPPLILVFTAFYVLIFSTILIFDDFGLFPVQLMNIFYYEIRAFNRSIQRLSFNVPCLIKRGLLLTIWAWFTLSALSGCSLLGLYLANFKRIIAAIIQVSSVLSYLDDYLLFIEVLALIEQICQHLQLLPLKMVLVLENAVYLTGCLILGGPWWLIQGVTLFSWWHWCQGNIRYILFL